MLTQDFMEDFVFESNMIDPQPGHQNVPGDPHWDDHYEALQFVINRGEDKILAPPQDVHEVLMANLKGMAHEAGNLRTCRVMAGSRTCPDWHEVPRLLKNWEDEAYYRLKNEDFLDPEALVWKLHIDYETIHPFVDGNGRSGRLLMVNHALLLGIDPWIVKFDERLDYYARF